jgi:3-deoxy-D-manno-octulosonic-acid transferase
MTPRAWRSRALLFNVLIIGLAPLALAALAHRVFIKRRPLPGLGDKLSGDGPAVTPSQVLVHGVSLGEVMLMRPLVPKLEAALGTRCLLTASTSTGGEALAKHFADHDRAWWPLDLPWAVDRFLARTRPRLVVLLELEVWPLMLLACARRGIPVVVVNGRITDKSVRGYRRAGGLLRPLLANLKLVVAQNAAWGAGFRALGIDRVRLAGSMKADIVRPADTAAMQAESARIGLSTDAPILLLASTGAGEEEAAIHSWKKWGPGAEKPWRLVICPRHPERGHELAELCRRLALDPQRTSQGARAASDPRSVVIVDEIGRLAALYALCAASNGIAVVGGGLGSKRGGQNMLEAAAAQACTVVGWDQKNQPDAMATLRAADGVVEIPDPVDIHPRLFALSKDPERRRALGVNGHAAWAASRGATDRVVTAVRDAVNAG